jgi:hypothetical protein
MYVEASKQDAQVAEVDIEKGSGAPSTDQSPPDLPQSVTSPDTVTSLFGRLNKRIESMAGFEARGLERVPLDERLPLSVMGLLQMHLLW